jgi:hypothetical protein
MPTGSVLLSNYSEKQSSKRSLLLVVIDAGLQPSKCIRADEARHARRQRELSEEAFVSLHIALEASFSLVIRLLKQQGVPNATAHDAAAWLHDHFDASFDLPVAQSTDKYFGEFHDQRVMTMHPASRWHLGVRCPHHRKLRVPFLAGARDFGDAVRVSSLYSRGLGRDDERVPLDPIVGITMSLPK